MNDQVVTLRELLQTNVALQQFLPCMEPAVDLQIVALCKLLQAELALMFLLRHMCILLVHLQLDTLRKPLHANITLKRHLTSVRAAMNHQSVTAGKPLDAEIALEGLLPCVRPLMDL